MNANTSKLKKDSRFFCGSADMNICRISSMAEQMKRTTEALLMSEIDGDDYHTAHAILGMAHMIKDLSDELLEYDVGKEVTA
jgi:hypothetical protein